FGTAASGTGAGQVGFTVNVQRFGGGSNARHVVAPIAIPAASTPVNTAGLCKAAIEAFPGLRATVSPNNPETGNPDGSCDVLISEVSGGRVTITNLTPVANQDQDQTVQAIGLTMSVHFRNSLADYHVGHPEQRNLVKSLDTPGDIVLDVQVVDVVVGVGGFT